MKLRHVIVMSIGVVSLIALSASATSTSVNDLWGAKPNIFNFGAEWNLYNSGVGSNPGNGIMEYLYGTFTRVNDANDIRWVGASGGAIVDSVYATSDQALYTAGFSGTPISSQILSKTTATSGAPSRSGAGTFTPITQPFLFLDKTGTGQTGTWAYSDPALNGNTDRMVTFSVTGYMSNPGGLGNVFTPFADGSHYVIAFEDGTDFDFNDLVVELSGVSPENSNGVPDGGSTLALLGGAICVLGTLSRRFRK